MRVVLIQRAMTQYRAGPLLVLQRALGGNLAVITSGEMVRDGKSPFFSLPPEIPHKRLAAQPLTVRFGGRTYNFVWQKRLGDELDFLKPDVILCEGESNLISNLVIAAWARRRRVPFVWWSLGRVRGKSVSLARNLIHLPLRTILRRAGAIVCYSSYARAYYHSQYGIPSERLFVAVNCIDDRPVTAISVEKRHELRGALGVERDHSLLIYVGALTVDKRPDLFVDVSESLQRRVRDMSSVIIGDGPLRRGLERRSAGQRILFSGRILDGVDGYFQAADVFVMPGLGGLALHQAMVNGLPVICAPADGTELDLVEPGRNGFVVESTDPEVWADRIHPLLLDRDLRAAMGKRSREIVEERANVSLMAQQIVRALEYAVSTFGASPAWA